MAYIQLFKKPPIPTIWFAGKSFFLSIPIIVKLSITVYVDLGLMFFSTASLLMLLKWAETGYQTRYIMLAGICCGLAAGTKYNGLVTIFLLTMFVPVIFIRSTVNKDKLNTKAISWAAIFLAATMLTFSPWLVRNAVWTGNPIYPLYNSLFQSSPSEKSVEKQPGTSGKPIHPLKQLTSRKSNVLAIRKLRYHETWWQTLLLPIRFFFEGQDDNPRYFDGKLNPFLFILPFFAFFGKSQDRQQKLEKYFLLAFSILFFFLTFFQESLRIRYIVPIIPALVILSMFGLNNVASAFKRAVCLRHFQYAGTIIVVCITIIMLTYNGKYLYDQFHLIQPISYLRGDVTRKDYITKFRPEYPVIQFANNVVRPDEKVLCIFLGNRGYYLNFHPIFERPPQKGILKDIINVPEADIKTELLKQNIHYILLRDDLTQYWLTRINNAEREKILFFFQKDTQRLLGEKGYSLFAINPK